MIVNVALKVNGVIVNAKTGKSRHRMVYEENPNINSSSEVIEGFVDEKNNFYNRIEAVKYAIKCKQIDKRFYAKNESLFSSDLW